MHAKSPSKCSRIWVSLKVEFYTNARAFPPQNFTGCFFFSTLVTSFVYGVHLGIVCVCVYVRKNEYAYVGWVNYVCIAARNRRCVRHDYLRAVSSKHAVWYGLTFCTKGHVQCRCCTRSDLSWVSDRGHQVQCTVSHSKNIHQSHRLFQDAHPNEIYCALEHTVWMQQ